MARKQATRPPGSRGRSGSTSKTSVVWAALALLVAVMIGIYVTVPVDPKAGAAGSSSADGAGGAGSGGRAVDLEKDLKRSARHIRDHKYSRAAQILKRTVEAEPSSAAAWKNLGIAERLGNGAEGVEPAIAAFRKAAALDPKSAEVRAYLSSALSSTARLDEARKMAFEALALDPLRVDALTLASRLTNFSDPADAFAGKALMEKLTMLAKNEGSTTPREEVQVHFALFKALDEAGETSAAAKHLLTANGLFHEMNLLAEGADAQPLWSKAATRNLLLSILYTFPGDDGSEEGTEDDVAARLQARWEEEEAQCNDDGESVRPLMVVGMPRSGSTILQQVLAGHPQVHHGDEYVHFAAAIQSVVNRHVTRASTAIEQLSVLRDADAAAQVHAQYLAALPSVTFPDVETSSSATGGSGKKRYLVDKQLSNVWWLSMLPPCARAIIVQRDEMDVGFGNFKTMFSSPGYEFSYDQEELGWRIRLTQRVVAHWLHTLPPQKVTVVNYADLVQDPNGTVHELLDWLDLPFHEPCLRPHENDLPIATASALQLRGPLQDRYQGKWRGYASSLEPMMRAIADATKWVRSLSGPTAEELAAAEAAAAEAEAAAAGEAQAEESTAPDGEQEAAPESSAEDTQSAPAE